MHIGLINMIIMLIESYECIADEIIDEIKDVDYLFMAISSAGSISGVSRRIKKSPRILK